MLHNILRTSMQRMDGWLLMKLEILKEPLIQVIKKKFMIKQISSKWSSEKRYSAEDITLE